MKRLFLLLLVGIYGCGLKNIPHPTASPAPIIVTVTPTAMPLTPLLTAALGDVNNLLNLPLAPAPRVDPNALDVSKVLVAHLEKSIGYQFITIAPIS